MTNKTVYVKRTRQYVLKVTGYRKQFVTVSEPVSAQ
jgi:hypothetical protein